MNKRIYGCLPDKHDNRDLKYTRKIVDLPTKVDLSSNMPSVYDQENIGSCVFNAIAGGFEYLLPIEKKENFMPSRLFAYFNYREKEGNIQEDTGATIRGGFKICAKLGFCKETNWPYDKNFFTTKPSIKAYNEGLNHQILKYERIRHLYDMKECLAEGYPFVAGIKIYTSFESSTVAKTGIVPMPDIEKEELFGGHAVLVVGYDDTTSMVKVRNSWSEKWGDKGYFYLPYHFITDINLASDFWTIRLTE
jgi:C1A family cysteine protease